MRPARLTLPALLMAPVLTLVACGGEGPAAGSEDTGAAGYPTERITMYVPFAAGGPTDLAARTVGDCLSQEFDQTVVVENRPGGSGSLAMQAMLAGGNEGYSLSMIGVPSSAINPLQEDVGYTNEDYIPVAAVTGIPAVLAVGADSRFTDAEAFFDFARANPGELSVGLPGASTSQALELQRLADMYDVQVTGVPFSGSAEAITVLLGGNVDAVFLPASPDVMKNVDAGSFVPLAVGPAEPVDYLPDVPTLADLGFPELTYSVSIIGLAAPAGTPDEVVQTLEELVSGCLEQPEVVDTLGEEYVPDEFIGSEDFQARIDEIVEVYGPLL